MSTDTSQSENELLWNGPGSLSFLEIEYIKGKLLQGYSLWIPGTTDENKRRDGNDPMYMISKDLLDDERNGLMYLLMLIEEVMGKFSDLRQGLYGNTIEIELALDGDSIVNSSNCFQRLIKMKE